MLKKIINLILEFVYSIKFSNHNKKVFKNSINNPKNVIIMEVIRLYGSHIGYSYICNSLIKYHSASIGLIKPYFIENRLNEILNFFLLKANLFHYKIYNSFGKTFFINFKKNKITKKKYFKYLKSIKSNNDLLNFKIEGVLYGDLIYDSYLRFCGEHTVNLKDEKFINFFFKSIDYYFFCKSLFKNYNIKAVVLSHTVYLTAVLGRIALKNNINFYCLGLGHCVSLSKKFFYIEDFKLYKSEFFQLKKNSKEKLILLGKKDLQSNIKGKASEGLENLERSPFAGIIDKNVVSKNKKIKILVASHCFYDSPHVYGKFLFNDFYEWLVHLGKISEKTDYEWYLKIHPNKIYEKRNKKILNNFLKIHKKFILVENNISHFSFIDKIDYVLTIHGNIGLEYALFGVKVINGSPVRGRFSNFNFNLNPKSINKYDRILLNLKKESRMRIDKEEIYTCHCINKIFVNSNYIIKYNRTIKKLGWNNLNSYVMIKFWLKNFNLKKHYYIDNKISSFIKESSKKKKFMKLVDDSFY